MQRFWVHFTEILGAFYRDLVTLVRIPKYVPKSLKKRKSGAVWLSRNKGEAIPQEENTGTKAKCAALSWPNFPRPELDTRTGLGEQEGQNLTGLPVE